MIYSSPHVILKKLCFWAVAPNHTAWKHTADQLYILWYLDGESAQNDGAEDGISENAIKHVPLSMDFACVDLVEELHHDEGVEDDGVVLGWRRMQRRVPATVNVKDLLAWITNTALDKTEDPLWIRCFGNTFL